jgi:1,4-dihydroxy-2-naphthoyl-CoA hydrolase
MSLWKTPISLEILRDRGLNTMVQYLNIEFTEIGDDFIRAIMPVDDKTKQPIGIMHGGASCVLADIKTHYCVGLAIYTNHIRSVRAGKVTGHAIPIHLGKSTQVWSIDILDDANRLISSTRLTMAVLNRKATL